MRNPDGQDSGVLLFLPPGGFSDHHLLFSAVSERSNALVMVPARHWITAEVAATGRRNRLSFLDLSGYLESAGSAPSPRPPQPPAAGKRPGAGPVRALIRGGNGLTWKDVRIEVRAGRRIRLTAPGQDCEYGFPPNIRIDKDHAIGILMRLAATGEWRNPALGAPDYFRVSKAFSRLRQVIMGLVSLPGDPFRKHRGAYIPVFRIGVHHSLLPENQRDRRR
jgi:hypothetical protein